MKKYKKKCYNCGNVDRFTIKEMSNLHFCQRCYKQHDTMCDVFANSVLELEQQNKRYREALKFYAEESNYDYDVKVDVKVDGIGDDWTYKRIYTVGSKILDDGGEKARKALEGEE